LFPTTLTNHRCQVALPSDTYEALAALAAREGKSIAHVANEQLQQLSGAAN
jgi:hypothetical protein